MASSTHPKRGSLTIAGTGIATLAHMTLETVSHIKEADKVYYIVTDPVTQAFIEENAKGPTFDLSVYYDADKYRYTSYVQMAEVMLNAVREGCNVLGLFYGHPGIFVSPSHRALAIAREEGYEARMLPGVSAEDYMFADLGLDPALPGCVCYEATNFLIRNKPLNPATHNILWQVGAVGITAMDFENSKFSLLVDRLERDLGPNHKVVHYVGAVLPQSATIMETYTIAELRKPEVIKRISTTSSTFYIPPRDSEAIDYDMVARLGIPPEKYRKIPSYPPNQWAGPNYTSTPAYGPEEKAAVSQLANHVVPNSYKTLHASPAMKKVMIDLATDRSLYKKYEANRDAFVDAVKGLTELEKVALKMGTDGSVYKVMSATQADIELGKEPSIEELEEGRGRLLLVVITAAVVV
ncbi:tetrapyrrole methylase [Serendipita vermifera]|uniref:Methyltransferase/ribosomally synthesized type I borosin cyclic peptide precursor sveMA n=1 Tax=Serendipita vermifera subsp. bescii TaxID=109899 RepID=SVEMA_SERVB|nr:RecName: Full=Methyltransferase/ribosomally synthesized type I borosin cyclic peptide precursor sveMA; AltName: Full=Type I borosin cyclic peptide biosynthesis cluster protein MA; Contains: RecName: Full=N-methyltranferase sveM; Contains: RecName: Full=Ribosomally synthesized type I borosin core peptide; Flags: Precursor [Serendipita vermifera]PVG01141.1 tetrapyrrole methylase [Serendipita vermifera]